MTAATIDTFRRYGIASMLSTPEATSSQSVANHCSCEPGGTNLGHEADCLARERRFTRQFGGPVLVAGSWASEVGGLLDEIGADDVFTDAPEHIQRVRELRERAYELSGELESAMLSQLEAADAH